MKTARFAMLAAGFAFLYGPIALVVLYSFNASRLVAVWGGFSTHWYGALLHDDQLMASAVTSLEVALASAAIATVLGTLAALTLARVPRFAGRSFFVAMVYAPLVLPEVILGVSLLLLFVALGVARGIATVVAAHATVSLCYATVVVRARLAGLDRSVEEAAADLGAPPFAVFRRVTLPLIAPAVVAAFLLAMTLSLDDLVIASFTTGPGSTTLPMRIYSAVRLGVSPEINAASTLLIGVVGVALFLGAVFGRAKEV